MIIDVDQLLLFDHQFKSCDFISLLIHMKQAPNLWACEASRIGIISVLEHAFIRAAIGKKIVS